MKLWFLSPRSTKFKTLDSNICKRTPNSHYNKITLENKLSMLKTEQNRFSQVKNQIVKKH